MEGVGAKKSYLTSNGPIPKEMTKCAIILHFIALYIDTTENVINEKSFNDLLHAFRHIFAFM